MEVRKQESVRRAISLVDRRGAAIGSRRIRDTAPLAVELTGEGVRFYS